MGQKVHPRSLRLGLIDDWDSTWFHRDLSSYAKNVKEDSEIRKFVKNKLKGASVSSIKIERKAQRLGIKIITGRSGMVVGRGGQGIDNLRKELVKLTQRKDVQIDVLEVAKVDADAQLIAESIASQLERRVAFRRAIKQSIQRAMRSGVQGIKVMASGRLGGAEIARTEWSKEGRIPLHTFRADIHYGFAEAKTVFGIIGVKVWVFKGEVMPGEKAIPNIKLTKGPDDRGPRRGPGGAEGRRRGSSSGGRRRSGKVTVSKIEEGSEKPEASAPSEKSE